MSGLTRAVALAAAVAASAGLGPVSPPPAGAQEQRAKDKTVDFTADDAQMNAAIAKARGSLAEFWRAFDKPQAGEERFTLKVAIPYGKGSREHFWLVDIARAGQRLTGTIANDPNKALHVRLGQRYTFGEDEVTDWMFRRNGRIVGAETLRVMLPRLPKAQADSLRAQLEKP